MTDEEMATCTSALLGTDRYDELVPHYLGIAKGAVTSYLFPYDAEATWDKVPERYHARTCEIAVFLVNKRGAEGEVAHSENGVSRSYESAGIPASYFRGMVPFAGVPA